MLAMVLPMMCTPPLAVASDFFTSPSGNIACAMEPAEVRCDIRDRAWSPPARPAECPSQTGFGQGIRIRAQGPAGFVCGGDTTFGAGSALPYGQYQANGGVSCNSEPSGMRCSNSDGHGFTLSREAYSLF